MNIVRTIVIAFLIAGAALLLVFGPRSDGNIPKDRTIVEYWEKWTGKEGEMLRSIVDDYNNGPGKTDHIYVRCLTTSEIAKKTLVAIAAGTPPDVAGLWDFNLVQYASLDAIEPLDGLIQEGDYKPVYWNMCTWNGHLYATVSTPATIALFYHKKVFEDNADALRKAGLDPTRPPETFDEFERYARVFDIIQNSHVIRAGFVHQEPGWWLRYTSFWFNQQIFDPEIWVDPKTGKEVENGTPGAERRGTGKFLLTAPKTVKAFEWIADYSQRMGKDAVTEFKAGLGTFDSPQNAFFYDPKRPFDLKDPNSFPRVVMELQGPWTANFIYNRAPQLSTVLWPRVKDPNGGPDMISNEEFAQTHEGRQKNYEWAVAPFPSAEPGIKDATYATTDILVIPKGAKHSAEARIFLKWFNSQPVMEKLCNLHSKNSPLTHVSDEFIQHHTNPYIDVFEKLAMSPNAISTPKIPINQEATDELNAVVESVALLRETPAVALANAQTRLQAKYDDFMERQRLRKASLAK